jgi:hypothetical protein
MSGTGLDHSYTYYFAATYARNEEMRRYRDELERTIVGGRVTSRWIDQHGRVELEAVTTEWLNNHPDECWQTASIDIEDMTASAALLLFTGDGEGVRSRGGRHTEFGYASSDFASYDSPRLIVVGPRENVFHCNPAVEVFSTWTRFLDAEVERWTPRS